VSLDRRRIAASFASAAAGYDQAARLQQVIETELLARATELPLAPTVVLDLGAGTGRASASLKQRFPKAEVIALDIALPMLKHARKHQGWWRPFRRVNADVRALPIADASCDFLFSNLCLQWIEDLRPVFAEFRRVLKPGGWLLFSSFGPDSLHELRAAWATVDDEPHVNVFLDMHDVGDALLAQGFKDPMLDVERYRLGYDSVLALMKELKAIGAHNVDDGRRRGLTTRRALQQVIAAYEAHRIAPDEVVATYEIVFAQAQAPADGQPRREMGQDVASVSLAQMRDLLKRKRPGQ